MRNLRIMLLTVFAMLVSGLNFPVGKMALAFGSPFVLLAIRFIAAGLLMLPFIAKRPHPRRAADWLKIAVIGLLQSALVMAGIYLSMKTISSGSSSILSSTNPIWFIIFSFLLYRVRYRAVQWAGVLIGFAGVAVAQGFTVQLENGFWYAIGAGMALGAGNAPYFPLGQGIRHVGDGRVSNADRGSAFAGCRSVIGAAAFYLGSGSSRQRAVRSWVDDSDELHRPIRGLV